MFPYHSLDHITELQLMCGYLTELVLLHNSQNQILVRFQQLMDVESSDLREQGEPLHIHPLEDGLVNFVGIHFVRQMAVGIKVVLLLFVNNNCWQFLKVKVLSGNIFTGGVEESVLLVSFRRRVVGIPHHTLLLANKHKEYRVGSLQHIHALSSRD